MSITGSLIILIVHDFPIAFGGSSIAFLLANFVYLIMVTWLLRSWFVIFCANFLRVLSTEWELSESNVVIVFRTALWNYLVFSLLAILQITNIVLYIADIYRSWLYYTLLAVFNASNFAAISFQFAVAVRLYIKEARGIPPNQIKVMMFF